MKDKKCCENLKNMIRALSKKEKKNDVELTKKIFSVMKQMTPVEIYDFEKQLAGESIRLDELFPEWEIHLVKMIEIDKK